MVVRRLLDHCFSQLIVFYFAVQKGDCSFESNGPGRREVEGARTCLLQPQHPHQNSGRPGKLQLQETEIYNYTLFLVACGSDWNCMADVNSVIPSKCDTNWSCCTSIHSLLGCTKQLQLSPVLFHLVLGFHSFEKEAIYQESRVEIGDLSYLKGQPYRMAPSQPSQRIT